MGFEDKIYWLDLKIEKSRKAKKEQKAEGNEHQIAFFKSYTLWHFLKRDSWSSVTKRSSLRLESATISLDWLNTVW